MKNKLPPLFKDSLGNQLKERLMYSFHHTSYICMINLQIPNISDHLPLLPFVQPDDKYQFSSPFFNKTVFPHYYFFILYYFISEYNIW